MIARHLPNALTALRLVAVPWVVWLVQARELRMAAAVVAAAALTDALDGALARRHGWQSWLGGWLDPLADKALVVAGHVLLADLDRFFTVLAMVVIGRDAVIVAGALAYRALVGPLSAHPTRLGKLTSPVQLAFVVGVLATWPVLPNAGVTLAAWIVGGLTLASGIEYVVEWSRRAHRHWPTGSR